MSVLKRWLTTELYYPSSTSGNRFGYSRKTAKEAQADLDRMDPVRYGVKPEHGALQVEPSTRGDELRRTFHVTRLTGWSKRITDWWGKLLGQ